MWQLGLAFIWPSLGFLIFSTATQGLGFLDACLLGPLGSLRGQTEVLHPSSMPLRDKAAEAQGPQQKCECLELSSVLDDPTLVQCQHPYFPHR